MLEITKEDVFEKMGVMKRYYSIPHTKESEEYKKFINVYLKHKYVLPAREQIVLDSG